MRKSAVIGLGIGIPVVLILIILGLNMFAISNLQFRGQSIESLDIVDMSADTKFEICNPTFFPASFEKLEIAMNYKSTNFGTFTMWGKTIQPQSPILVDGRVNVNGQAVMQLLLAGFSSAFGVIIKTHFLSHIIKNTNIIHKFLNNYELKRIGIFKKSLESLLTNLYSMFLMQNSHILDIDVFSANQYEFA